MQPATQTPHQPDRHHYAALLLPLLAFGVIMLVTRSQHRLSGGHLHRCRRPVAPGGRLSAGAALADAGTAGFPDHLAGFRADGDSHRHPAGPAEPVSMLTVVAMISFLVQIYSLGYMAGDPGFGRYYGCMSLFAWAMLTLTVSSSLLQLYIFWELVGLASYLLIGFWFDKFSASEAGKKAFVMTRTG
jgi:NADH-quinone oxidoreductase subunit L